VTASAWKISIFVEFSMPWTWIRTWNDRLFHMNCLRCDRTIAWPVSKI
jgi:hypothetical protein